MQYTIGQITEIIHGKGILVSPGNRITRLLTDSRSLLSYPRHHYFRRILCNYLGGLVESGEITEDIELIGSVIKDIAYNNSIKYFNMK